MRYFLISFPRQYFENVLPAKCLPYFGKQNVYLILFCSILVASAAVTLRGTFPFLIVVTERSASLGGLVELFPNPCKMQDVPIRMRE